MANDRDATSGGASQDSRRDFPRKPLAEREVYPDPIAQFSRWFDEAVKANLAEPNAMTVATAGTDGAPSARVILLKSVDLRGFVFYTNYTSRKSRDLAANPRAALAFFWQAMERQVRVEGEVEKVSRQESEEYFRSRPRESQIGAWASRQSDVAGSRKELDDRYDQLAAQFKDKPVPPPDFWGGYRVVPSSVEFWQGRPGRLHDRLVYFRQSDGSWQIRRLQP